MATTVVMPQMGYDMREGTVVKWRKREGEPVARGEVIADIQTDKATVEFEAYAAGILRKIVAQEGVPVPVGQLIAVITAPDEPLPANLPSPGTPAPAAAAAPTSAAAVSAPVAPQAASAGEVRASPIARRIARERGIDLTTVTGTGPGGRIVEKDVEDFTAASSAAPPRQASAADQPAAAPMPVGAQRVELSRMRQAIARVTVDSKREAPHFYVSADIDMTRAMSLRRDINEHLAAERRVSVNDFIIKACAIALGRHAKFNAFFRGDHLQMNADINIGIAIALPAGLMVPGINACQSKSLVQIADASKDLVARANSGALRNDEYSNTTFSISNLGPFDVDSFAAIIFPPHAAVLAVGRVKEQPVVREGQLAVAQIMKATLSVDHRVADGAEAAQFLVEIRKLLETPLSLLA
ncbi:MAG: 2-oxo acid dehydrogenase subunit E2 [Dehalococcoidia bacterium]|nr:2-oxo acid dehydrogenase subunit E2 [Dehalococcoidia bacterium]MSQ16769.1 2-oxo acid dehydrogenase subunit E2 [Dehalococcoidia bacterium]